MLVVSDNDIWIVSKTFLTSLLLSETDSCGFSRFLFLPSAKFDSLDSSDSKKGKDKLIVHFRLV